MAKKGTARKGKDQGAVSGSTRGGGADKDAEDGQERGGGRGSVSGEGDCARNRRVWQAKETGSPSVFPQWNEN